MALSILCIVTHMPIARQRLGKHIPEVYALNNSIFIAKYRANNQPSLTEYGVIRGVRAEL
jgi:hypothetical protein